jgi:calcineurin-like phosphoesterase family protein
MQDAASSEQAKENKGMKQSWFISDTHFGHANIITFEDQQGRRIRPFASVEEMDELLVKNWNARVGQYDRVYHLGDVVINRKRLPILDRLNGKKVLIKGNHDIFPLKDYTPYFEDIRAFKVYPAHGIICSHVPVHPQQLAARFKRNIHGHLHERVLDDARYRNICVEHTNYAPLSFEELIAV